MNIKQLGRTGLKVSESCLGTMTSGNQADRQTSFAIDDALIRSCSGHASRQSPEVYSRLAIGEAQEEYDKAIGRFPV
jgi:hypothetical protein